MRKYIFVAFASAVLTGGMTMVGFVSYQNNSSQKDLRASSVRQTLASDQAFISSVQAKIAQNALTETQIIKGDKGDTGSNGTAGSAGSNGNNGTAGQNGSAGTAGQQGQVGTDGSVGARGEVGPTGPRGPLGQKGDIGLTGPAGPQGIKGDTGAQGLQGTQGIQGLQGATGPMGPQGLQGLTGAIGAQGAKGDTGNMGAQGIQGIQGPIGLTGATGATGAQGIQGIQGDSGVISISATGLSYNSSTKDISLSSGYAIPLTSSATNWNTAYSWGNHATVGYAVLAGKSGGQQLTGGTAANEALTLVANSASASNTATNAGIILKVGNSGAATALTIRNDGNVGIGTSTPANKLTVYGDVAISTNGTDAIKPVQFVQVTGLSDNPTVTTFNSSTYSTADWNAAVVGFNNGGSCGTAWTGGALSGFKYYWDNNAGNWRLNIDMYGPTDGCNSVQVMFVRKELSSRANYGF